MRLLAATFLALGALGCSTPEPGSPTLNPTPLFSGYQSYRTVDEIRARSLGRQAWSVLFDEKGPARGRCPRFDQFEVEFPAHDAEHAGSLHLVFINGRLKSTLFSPQDFSAYLEYLNHSGIHASIGKDAHLEPATTVWVSDRPRSSNRAFVGWRDERFESQVSRWIEACS